MTTAWERVTSETKLVSLPDVYLKLKAVLDSEHYVLTDIEQVISLDPALTARLLRMVNSAYFGLEVEISSVSRAINLLGGQQIHDLVLATSVSRAFKQIPPDLINLELFWRHSVYCAAASRVLAADCNVLDSDRLFVTGLLREIGHLVMYSALPDLCQAVIYAAKERNTTIAEIERSYIGFDYAMVGGELMRQWNLPKSLQEPTFYHLEPAKSVDFALETAIIHIAAKMTDAYAAECTLNEAISKIDGAALQITDLTEEQCLVADRVAKNEVKELMSLIFSGAEFKATA